MFRTVNTCAPPAAAAALAIDDRAALGNVDRFEPSGFHRCAAGFDGS